MLFHEKLNARARENLIYILSPPPTSTIRKKRAKKNAPSFRLLPMGEITQSQFQSGRIRPLFVFLRACENKYDDFCLL